MRKESYDGARVVAGVGFNTTSGDVMFKGRGKPRISLRQAFGQSPDGQETAEARRTHTSREDWRDSISSLVDLEERRIARDSENNSIEPKVVSPSQAVNPTISLFSSAATPLLSRHDAVALRNVGCLDFASMHDGDAMAGQSNKGLRKMRSVDALELALKKMEIRKQLPVSKAPSQIHNSIPESFSTDSLTNEDFVNATTTTTCDATGTMITLLEEPIQRSTTPRLVITSPTGMRSPQPLVLDGQEFEPRSISPEMVRVIRPVASRRSGWKLNAVIAKPKDGQSFTGLEDGVRGRSSSAAVNESRIPSNIPKRSASKKKTRMVKSREGNSTQEESKLPVPIKAKKAKKRLSRSCNDLRENALAQFGDAVTSAGKLSGSEQIRALRQDIINRNNTQHQSVLADEPRQRVNTIPCSSASDEDDPFNDFVAVAKSSNTSNSSARPHIDRAGMSPIPFEHPPQRRPLSTTQQFNVQHPSSTAAIPAKTLVRKTSGVGLACLVEKQNNRPTSASSHRSDENNPGNSLMDSPTAHVVKKRSSRPRLGQH